MTDAQRGRTAPPSDIFNGKVLMAKRKKKGKPYQWKGRKPPKGAPDTIKSMARTYRLMLDESAARVPDISDVAMEMGLNPNQTSIAAVLVLAQLTNAATGNHHAAKDVADRVDNFLNRGMTRTQLAALAEAIVEIISQEVRDPQVRSNIGERIMALAADIGSDID